MYTLVMSMLMLGQPYRQRRLSNLHASCFIAVQLICHIEQPAGPKEVVSRDHLSHATSICYIASRQRLWPCLGELNLINNLDSPDTAPVAADAKV